MEVVIVDYGMGNLRSVRNAFNALGSSVEVSNNPKDLRKAKRVVLPGVGAFGDGIKNLRNNGWIDALEEEVRVRAKPFIGICLGMQLLGTSSTEYGIHTGLNWVPGIVERLSSEDSAIRIPHIGWNDVIFVNKEGLYADLADSETFYFVHSYVLNPEDKSSVSGFCFYGMEFTASVEMDNICATQYHPEKSQKIGLKVLENFLRM